MKPKSTLSDCAPASLNYVFAARAADHASKRPELISSNMAGGDDPRALAGEFAAVHRLRPEVKKPVWHCSLSLPEGERLTSTKWAAIVDRFLNKMGFDVALTPFVVVRHNDKPKSDHVHVVLTRISLDSKLWHGAWQAFEMIKACQELEREFGLRVTPGLHGDDAAEAKLKRPERVAGAQSIVNANRSKSQPKIDTAEMARLLRECAKLSNGLPTFTAAAAAAGIKVLPNLASTGYVSGLSVVPPGRRKPVPLGDATGKNLTWPKLLKIFEQNDAVADAARHSARNAVATADRRASERVEARLLENDRHDGADVSKSDPVAILPSLVTKEAQSMANHHVDPNDRLGFLAESPPPRPDGRIDDTALIAQADAGKREARERIDRQRATAQAQIEDELKSATKAQLKRLRVALTTELQADDDAAIEQMLNRLLRLVVRLLTLNQVVLPHSEGERRILAARHTVQLIDAENRRRADVDVQPASVPESPRPEPKSATLRFVRAHDARPHSPTTAHRDRDENARELDAHRERNRK